MRELSLDNCRIDKRYDIVRRLGVGSYSEIFLAKDNFAAPNSPRRNVVIKALNTGLQDDPDRDLDRTLVENFQNEALSLDKVRHPNIVSRLGHGTNRDLRGKVFHYLVLEYMPGGDLQAMVRRGPLGIRRSLIYLEQICSGLEHAHEQGVIHRDIKPHNILLSGDGETVKISDFGVARGLLNDGPITRVGSNVYAPPEHSPLISSAASAGAQIGPSSDIYSLAKTAYAMITGEIPRKFTGGPIDSLPSMGESPKTERAILEVLRRATQDETKLRYATVSEFWEELTKAASEEVRDEEETVVSRRYIPPQPHVSRGYTPLPPKMPSFTDDLLYKHGGTGLPDRQKPLSVKPGVGEASRQDAAAKPKRPRLFLRLAAAGVILATIAGGIYGTAGWLSNINVIPDSVRPFITRSTVASSDVYLRSTPNTDNAPIGIVTKKSKLRIIKVQDNWYQVDIIEQGRRSAGAPEQGRGWVSGKYLEL
jgi:serine/threonine protein kinase